MSNKPGHIKMIRVVECGDFFEASGIPDEAFNYLPSPDDIREGRYLLTADELADRLMNEAQERRENILKAEPNDASQLAIFFAVEKLKTDLPRGLYINVSEIEADEVPPNTGRIALGEEVVCAKL